MPADPTESLSPAQRRSLETVLALLAEERASVSSVTDDRAWQVHVGDSLTGVEVPDQYPRRVLSYGPAKYVAIVSATLVMVDVVGAGISALACTGASGGTPRRSGRSRPCARPARAC